MRLFAYIYGILLLILDFAQGANLPKFNEILSVKGFPSVNVYALLQDSHGYLWVGTESGLYRFDGYTEKQFIHDPKDSNTISDDWVYCLEEDDNGSIWIGTANGLNCYSYISGYFKHHYSGSGQVDLDTVSINCIAKDNRAIWVGTEGKGLFCIFPDKLRNSFNESKIYHILHYEFILNKRDLPSGQTIYSICFDKYGRGWLGTNAGLSVFTADVDDPSFVTIHHTERKNSIVSNRVLTVCYDSAHNSIWAISNGMIDKISISSGAIDTTRLSALHFYEEIRNLTRSSSSQFSSFIVSANNTYWLSILGYGVLEFKYSGENSGNNLIDSHEEFKDAGSSYFYTIYQHDPSVIWFGTSDGLSKLVTEPQVFRQFSNLHSLKKGQLSCVYKDIQGDVWLGTITNKIIFRSDKGVVKYIHLPVESTQRGINNIVYCITRAGDGDVLIGSINGLYVLEGKSVARLKTSSTSDIPIKHFTHENSALNGAVMTFATDSGSCVWVGTSEGLYYYLSKKQALLAVSGLPHDLDIYSIAVQDQKRIWLATQNGLHLYNHLTGNDSIFTTINSSGNGFISNEINALSLDKTTKQLWIATDNGVIIHADSSKKFKQLSLNNHFARGQVSSLVCDADNLLWFITIDGLVKYNPAENDVTYFNEWYAPFKGGTTQCVLCQDPSGHILIGNENGIFSVNQLIRTSRSISQLVLISDLKIMGLSIFSDSTGSRFKLNHSVTLYPGQSELSVEFIAPNFINPDKTEYAYKFGNDTGWNYIGNTHFVSCPILNSGTFTFSVKATNEDGIWSESPTTFSVNVMPPFYKTGYFYALIATGFALILGLIFYTFYRSKLQRILFSQRIRNKIAGDLHDDIGSTMNSISLYSEIARQRAEREFPSAVPYFEKIGQDSRSIIGNMSDIVWMINPKNDSMETLLQRMENFAAQLLGPKGVAFRFNYSDKVKRLKPPMEARRNLFLIFKEALNNCVKYSECKTVKVNLLEHRGILHLFISDDGKGFDVAGNHSGNGLHNFRARAKEIGGTIDIQSFPDKGTTIHLEFKST